jgi:hypothetical protein
MANALGSLGEFQIDPNQDPSEIIGMARATGYEGGNTPPKALAGMRSAPQSAPPPKKLLTGPGHGPQLQKEWDARLAERPSAAPMTRERKAELARDCEKALTRLERAEARGSVPPELISEIKNNLGQLLAESVAEARKTAESQFAAIFSKRHLRVMAQFRDFTKIVWAERLWSQQVALAKKDELAELGKRVLEHLKQARDNGDVSIKQLSPEARSVSE